MIFLEKKKVLILLLQKGRIVEIFSSAKPLIASPLKATAKSYLI